MALVSPQRYRELQLAIRARALAEFALAWRVFRGDIESWRLFERLAVGIIRRWRRRSAGLAMARLREVSEAARTPEPQVVLPPDPPDEQLVRSLGATGLAGTWAALARGHSLEAAREIGLARASMAASRHVLDGGRETILAAAKASARSGADPALEVRWRRIAGPNACEFCRMLAGRGAVYRADTATFLSHDGCSCVAEPVFGAVGPTPPRELDVGPEELPGLEALEGEEWVAAAERWAQRHWPHIEWDLAGHGLDPRALEPALRQLDDLMRRFPMVAQHMEAVVARDLGLDVLAQATYVGRGRMAFNTRWFSDHSRLEWMFAHSRRTGFHAVPSIEGTVAHEFGHLFQGWATGTNLAFLDVVRQDGFGLVADTFHLVLRRLASSRLSRYARTSDVEAWAEAFSAAVLGAHERSRAVRLARGLIEAVSGRLSSDYRWTADLVGEERNRALERILAVARRLGLAELIGA